MSDKSQAISLNVNGRRYGMEVGRDEVLLDVLRNKLGLLGTKANCLEAECGVCTVLVDGAAVNSCILIAAQCHERDVTTIEGLATDGNLHALQQAFIDCGAVQCGYCIPGMIMTAIGFLKENPSPTRDEIREGICGTLCRCTGYQKIVDAIERVAYANR